jgi:hypothetical protein
LFAALGGERYWLLLTPLEQADDDILTSTVSDEAMEAAADTEKSPVATIVSVPVEIAWCC